LDHFCWFLHSAIGLRNRKFFVLFVLYSLALSLFALFLGLSDVVPFQWRARDLTPEGLLPGVNASDATAENARDVLEYRQRTALVLEAHSTLGVYYWQGLWISLPLNAVAVWFLADMACHCVVHICRNRTWLEPLDATYDVGIAVNVRAVLGEWLIFWFLPLPGTGPAGDGLTWPKTSIADSR